MLVLIMLCQTTSSQECDPDVMPASHEELQYRVRGNRCEGFHSIHPVGRFLEVVGVTEGRVQFQQDQAEVLRVSAPILPDHSVHIRAVGLPPKVYYRMDARLEPGETLVWPVKEVIYPQQLSASDIGVFGWIEEDTETVYVPVMVTPTLAPVENDGRIRLSLRTTAEGLEKALWQSSDEVDGECPGLQDSARTEIPVSPIQRWTPFEIILPASETGRLCVEIAAKGQRTGRWGKSMVRVIVKPAGRQ